MIKVSKPKAFDFNIKEIRATGSNQIILMNTLSTFFPEGERFFIKSVRKYRDVVDRTSDLGIDISRFIGQEAFHSVAHEQLNKKLYTYKYADLTKQVNFWLTLAFKVSPKFSLHTTAILEWYTAYLAKQVLADRYDMTEAEKKLWYVHATEEWEHRHVAEDLLELVGSKTVNKILFPVVSFIFFVTIAITYIINGGSWDKELFRKLIAN